MDRVMTTASSKNNVLLVALNSCADPHYFSLALGCLKAYAMADQQLAATTNIQIVDFCTTCNDPMQMAFYVANSDPHVLGLSCCCWNVDKMADLARVLRQIRPQTKIVAGGPEVTPIAEEFLADNPAVDVVVRGEGEASFAELLRVWTAGEGGIEDVAGVSYRDGEHVFANDDRPLIENLDQIPSPYLTGVLAPRDNVTYLETYRGCPYKCGYCFEGKNYPKLRHYSDDRIAAEIELIGSNPAVTTYSFIDPVFNLTKEKLAKMVDILAVSAKAGKTIHTVEVVAEHVDEETVSLLRRAGAVSTETGPQTANAETISNINRYFVRDKFARGIELMRDGGLKVLCDLIVGLPGDNFFSFCRSIDFVLGLRPGTIIFSTLNVLPGTAMRDEADKYGLKYDARPPHYVLRTDTFPFEEIRKAEIMASSLAKEYNAVSSAGQPSPSG